MTNRDFINNVHVNESNSFVNLLHHNDPEFEDEINIVEQSRYYSINEFKTILDRNKSGIQFVNLNCGGLPSKFNRFKISISSCNDTLSPVIVITIQETHFTHNTDLSFYELPEYTLVSDIARINSFGGVAIYIHNSFSFSRLHTEKLHSTSQVYDLLRFIIIIKS